MTRISLQMKLSGDMAKLISDLNNRQIRQVDGTHPSSASGKELTIDDDDTTAKATKLATDTAATNPAIDVEGATTTAYTGGENMDVDEELIEDVDFQIDGPETQAVQLVHTHLVEAITHQVDELASVFYQEKLIGLSEYSSVVETMGMTSRKRAVQLLLAVTSTIRVVSANFDKFVKVLENHHGFGDIVKVMMERYCELKQPQDVIKPRVKLPPEPPVKNEETIVNDSSVLTSLTRPWLSKRLSSTTSIGEEELQIELEEIEKRLEKMKKGMEKRIKRMEMVKEKELRLTRQEVAELKERLDENEKQLAISNFQSKFFQHQLSTAQIQIAQLTREVVELKQQRPTCASQCEHYMKCRVLEKDNEKLEDLRLEHEAKIANLNAQIAYLLESSHPSR